MTRSRTDVLLDAAVRVAGWGWPVFLLGRTKRPLANCPDCPKRGHPDAHDPQACPHLTCHGFYAATRDPARLAAMITAHPDGLLAVRTGAAPDGAGIVGIDIDPGHGGRVDPALMVPTRAVASGNHGWHLYYRHPGPPVLSRPLPGAAGVDVKADGGYCVLPPSIHPDTHRPYRWANHRPIEEMAPRLAQLVLSASAALANPTPHPGQAPRPTGISPGTGPGGRGRVIRYPDKLIDACLAAVRRAPEGRRRVTLYGAARGIAKIILAGHLTLEEGVARLTEVGRHCAAQTDRAITDAITDAFTAEGLTRAHTPGQVTG